VPVAAQAGRSIELKTPSSCEVRVSDGNKLGFAFPKKDAYLSVSRWQFRDFDELQEHLASLISLEHEKGGLTGSSSRRGKYERRDKDGKRVFSFGDPILDLITGPAGELEIAGRSLDLARNELSSARRRGGLTQIDLAAIPQEGWLNVATRAAMGEGDFVLLEATEDGVALASTNPSQRDWFRNGNRDHLRFKAWKKSYSVYWSMGAEVETWNHDFDRARIDSRYLMEVSTGICTEVKTDNDSDTNDDYLDEYEWGINAQQPERVISLCTANWHGEFFSGQVEAGPACYEL
jgi:hypothetical protein